MMTSDDECEYPSCTRQRWLGCVQCHYHNGLCKIHHDWGLSS